MKKRIAINGFGRIGRNFLRIIMQDKKALQSLEIVAINIGPAKHESVAHMFKYDTLMGIYPGTVAVADNELIIDGHKIQLFAEKNPVDLPWKKLAIDWVVESSGHFTHRDDAQLHIKAGAKKVLITAPAHDEDVTIIPGVNDAAYNPSRDHIVALGSCTTNAFLPLLKVINESFGIQHALMTTIHAYTNTQVLLDVESDDLRRARAAALNIIPTTTGASDMVRRVLPALSDVVQAVSIRVPVAKVSLIDLVFVSAKPLSVELINDAFSRAAHAGSLHGIIDVTHEELVSSDFSGSNFSVIIDAPLTQVNGNVGKVFGWYDNEWGYSMRLRDFLVGC